MAKGHKGPATTWKVIRKFLATECATSALTVMFFTLLEHQVADCTKAILRPFPSGLTAWVLLFIRVYGTVTGSMHD